MTTTRRAALVTAACLALAGAPGAVGATGPLDAPAFAKVLTCAACHGANGNSRTNLMPIIAGLDPAYFKRQIENYAAGRRPSPEMEAYAKEIQFLGLDQIAAYFAAQKRLPTPFQPAVEAVARGRAAAAQCAICHGANGKGDAARLIPGLAGQPPGYLAQQMLVYKQDPREPADPLLAAKRAVMRTMQDSRFPDLAAYYSSLR